MLKCSQNHGKEMKINRNRAFWTNVGQYYNIAVMTILSATIVNIKGVFQYQNIAIMVSLIL